MERIWEEGSRRKERPDEMDGIGQGRATYRYSIATFRLYNIRGDSCARLTKVR